MIESVTPMTDREEVLLSITLLAGPGYLLLTVVC